MSTMPCKIVPVGKRRDGKMRYWCTAHCASALGAKGVKLSQCVAANEPEIPPQETLILNPGEFPGGIALWGAVPAVYDTTELPVDRGIHVHARREVGGKKQIDKTYRKVVYQTGQKGHAMNITFSELDAIYYMASMVLGHSMKFIACTKCGHPHLDKDWFSVHPHKKHLCAGCGRNFHDNEKHVGNPLMAAKAECYDFDIDRATKPSTKTLRIAQKDYPNGIQIWGSNQAILWTSPIQEESGIHVHAYADDRLIPAVDDTFTAVEIDGFTLNAGQIRTYMAQCALPHIRDRVIALECPHCRHEAFDDAEFSYTPRKERQCSECGEIVWSKTRLKKVIGNPFIAVANQLAQLAAREPKSPFLALRPEI